VRAAAAYEELIFDDVPLASIPFDETIGCQESVTNSMDIDEPPGVQTVQMELDTPQPIIPEIEHPQAKVTDSSELKDHHQNQHIEMSKLHQALAMFADLTGMSRSEWAALREILYLVKHGPESTVPDDVQQLPLQLSTLKDRMRRRLPLMDMRKAKIPVKFEKLPTQTESHKDKGTEKKQYTSIVETEIQFIDPVSLFKKILSSDIAKEMYIGPATFVDEPTELYHSHAWASSVRTTGGKYAHLRIGDNIGAVVFPSDFVYYRCQDLNCVCHEAADDEAYNLHIGRIYGVGYDRRANPCTTKDGDLALQIQEALYQGDERLATLALYPAHEDDELVLTANYVYIPESSVVGHANDHIYVDRQFGEVHEDPLPPETFANKVKNAKQAAEAAQSRLGDWIAKQQINGRAMRGRKPKIPAVPQSYPKYNELPTSRPREVFFVRRIVYGDRVTPLCHTHPIRAELEFEVYGRRLYESAWDIANGNPLTISCPLLTFIDGFGVYRNSYRSLMGFYIIPAALSEEDRNLQSNVFPIVLGPHGSDFKDVITALHSLADLDQGIMTEIKGEEVRICAFTMCYTGDMPQQAENSGLKGPRAHKFCRFCFIGSKAPDAILDIDIVTHGRFHVQTKHMQDMLAHQLTTQKARDEFGTQWGINEAHPPLASISPALDLILTRGPDAAHSEYGGLSNLMHFMLRDSILTKLARQEYAAVLRSWPFPPGCQRLQSPLHHLASYSLSDHARWSIIIPALLRHWLRETHVQPFFADQARQYGDPVNLIVATCAAIAKSNSVLMGRKISYTDRQNMDQIIRKARLMFSQLCNFASRSILANPRSRVGSRGGSQVPSVEASRSGSILLGQMEDVQQENNIITGLEKEQGKATRAAQYLNDTMRPNIHIGVHYPQFAEEYALPKNLNVLSGEDFHR